MDCNILLWGIGISVTNLNQLITNIHIDLKDLKLVIGLLAALPIGVIIHQFSVLIKNWLFSRICCELNDFPKKEFILKLDSDDKKVTYILERISNLNSFYYVRFDNGVLSPFLAWVTISFFMDLKIHCSWVASAIIIGLITVAYIPRICSEIKKYHDILNLCNPTPS